VLCVLCGHHTRVTFKSLFCKLVLNVGLRLLGIGRNQYIELMNKSRVNRRFNLAAFRKRINAKEHLPKTPIQIKIEPWWIVHVGFVTEEDIWVLHYIFKLLWCVCFPCRDIQKKIFGYCFTFLSYFSVLVFLAVIYTDETQPFSGIERSQTSTPTTKRNKQSCQTSRFEQELKMLAQ